jgi:hypothetical protein
MFVDPVKAILELERSARDAESAGQYVLAALLRERAELIRLRLIKSAAA